MTGPDVFRRSRTLFWTLLALVFFYRLGFGLASNFWTADERQIYLIGLQAFARHAWPYYGADVVWTESRLPGALQGLLISGPLSAVPAPESPFVLLNLLTCGALAGFASYLTRRLPQLPRWSIWVWLMTAPWTLHFGTHVVNTSYQLPASIAFFIGFFEAMPALSAGLIGPFGAWALMGLGLTWMMQMHLSWVLLPAYIVVAFVGTMQRTRLARAPAMVSGLLAGAAGPAVLILPTLARGGPSGTGGIERNVELHAHGIWSLVTILAQFLSFASTEINRFIGLDTADRLMLLGMHLWLVPLAAVLLVVAIVQPVMLVVTAIGARQQRPEWPAVRLLAAGTVLWVYASYTLSVRAPQAHAFYTVFPVATLFAMYAWSFHAHRRWFRMAAAAILSVNVIFHAGFALAEWRARSLYRDRSLVVDAIARHDDRLIGDRRAGFGIKTSGVHPPGFETAAATEDLKVTSVAWSRAIFGRVSTFDVTIQNDGRAAAYVDLQYRTTYYDGAGRMLDRREGAITEILQPGRARRWPRLVDGLAHAAAVSATFEIIGGERVIPDS